MAVGLTKTFPVLTVNIVAVEMEVATSPLWRSYCDRTASAALNYARSIAPVDTGTYRDSLFARVERASSNLSIPGAPAVIVGNDCDHWIEVEFQEPMRYRPLLRTLDSLKD